MEMHKLEGMALDAYLKMLDLVKLEAARVNNLQPAQAWGVNGALEILQLLPANLGVATLTSTTHYGYRFSVAVGATDGLISLTPVPANRVIGIYGFVDSTPVNRLTSQMNITKGTRIARQWPEKPTQSSLEDACYRLDPIVIPATNNLLITQACHNAGNQELTFLGVIAQPKS